MAFIQNEQLDGIHRKVLVCNHRWGFVVLWSGNYRKEVSGFTAEPTFPPSSSRSGAGLRHLSVLLGEADQAEMGGTTSSGNPLASLGHFLHVPEP